VALHVALRSLALDLPFDGEPGRVDPGGLQLLRRDGEQRAQRRLRRRMQAEPLARPHPAAGPDLHEGALALRLQHGSYRLKQVERALRVSGERAREQLRRQLFELPRPEGHAARLRAHAEIDAEEAGDRRLAQRAKRRRVLQIGGAAQGDASGGSYLAGELLDVGRGPRGADDVPPLPPEVQRQLAPQPPRSHDEQRLRLARPRGGRPGAARRRAAHLRTTLDTDACAVGVTRISWMWTCAGRVAAQTAQSAMSEAASGSSPW
jgi:hypothetical protein